jgi:hypothetical protein
MGATMSIWASGKDEFPGTDLEVLWIGALGVYRLNERMIQPFVLHSDLLCKTSDGRLLALRRGRDPGASQSLSGWQNLGIRTLERKEGEAPEVRRARMTKAGEYFSAIVLAAFDLVREAGSVDRRGDEADGEKARALRWRRLQDKHLLLVMPHWVDTLMLPAIQGICAAVGFRAVAIRDDVNLIGAYVAKVAHGMTGVNVNNLGVVVRLGPNDTAKFQVMVVNDVATATPQEMGGARPQRRDFECYQPANQLNLLRICKPGEQGMLPVALPPEFVPKVPKGTEPGNLHGMLDGLSIELNFMDFVRAAEPTAPDRAPKLARALHISFSWSVQPELPECTEHCEVVFPVGTDDPAVQCISGVEDSLDSMAYVEPHHDGDSVKQNWHRFYVVPGNDGTSWNIVGSFGLLVHGRVPQMPAAGPPAGVGGDGRNAPGAPELPLSSVFLVRNQESKGAVEAAKAATLEEVLDAVKKFKVLSQSGRVRWIDADCLPQPGSNGGA